MPGQVIITDALGKVHHFFDVPEPYPAQGGGWVVETKNSTKIFGATYVLMEWIANVSKEDNDQKTDD